MLELRPNCECCNRDFARFDTSTSPAPEYVLELQAEATAEVENPQLWIAPASTQREWRFNARSTKALLFAFSQRAREEESQSSLCCLIVGQLADGFGEHGGIAPLGAPTIESATRSQVFARCAPQT